MKYLYKETNTIIDEKELREGFNRFPDEIYWDYCGSFDEYVSQGIQCGAIVPIKMTDERKIEIFNEMINYIQDFLSKEKCLELLQIFEITSDEAEELGFFDFITEQLRKEEVM